MSLRQKFYDTRVTCLPTQRIALGRGAPLLPRSPQLEKFLRIHYSVAAKWVSPRSNNGFGRQPTVGPAINVCAAPRQCCNTESMVWLASTVPEHTTLLHSLRCSESRVTRNSSASCNQYWSSSNTVRRVPLVRICPTKGGKVIPALFQYELTDSVDRRQTQGSLPPRLTTIELRNL